MGLTKWEIWPFLTKMWDFNPTEIPQCCGIFEFHGLFVGFSLRKWKYKSEAGTLYRVQRVKHSFIHLVDIYELIDAVLARLCKKILEKSG